MARRGQDKSDKLHNRRKQALEEKDFKAKKMEKHKVPDVIISCEDAVSAPAYFKKIVDTLIMSRQITQDSFVVVPHDGGTQPSKVLERLKNYSDKNGKTYKDFQHKWMVIDRDIERVNGGGHSAEDFNKAVNIAKNTKQNLNIEVAYSNDAFELWYLLHFDYIPTSFLRDEINVRLIKKLKEKNPHKFSQLNKDNIKQANYTQHIFDELLDLQKIAIKNAKKLIESYGNKHHPESDNPSTTIYKLIEILNSLNKSE